MNGERDFMLNTNCRQDNNSKACEIAAPAGAINRDLHTKRRSLSHWLHLCASALILSSVALHSASVSAQTPHSQGRSCGSTGQLACPATTPVVSRWTYGPESPYSNSPTRFDSVQE